LAINTVYYAGDSDRLQIFETLFLRQTRIDLKNELITRLNINNCILFIQHL
jgi:hypothetical protein